MIVYKELGSSSVTIGIRAVPPKMVFIIGNIIGNMITRVKRKAAQHIQM